MSIDFLISVLDDMQNPAKVNRDKAANTVLNEPKLIKYLVDLTFDVNNKLSIKAAWVLEWICTHHGIEHILPYLDSFATNISTVHFDSAVRPCAKICEHLANAFTSKKDNKTKYYPRARKIIKSVKKRKQIIREVLDFKDINNISDLTYKKIRNKLINLNKVYITHIINNF